MSLNLSPRSAKFVNLSKDEQAGESSTMSPGMEAARAASTALRRSGRMCMGRRDGS